MIRFVSCVGPGGWESYGQRFYESFCAAMPFGTTFDFYSHDCEVPGAKKLEDHLAYVEFRARLKGLNVEPSVIGQMGKFYALFDPKADDADWVIWIDADTEWLRSFGMETLQGWLGGDFVYLNRPVGNEGSFYAFNTRTHSGKLFITEIMNFIHSGEFMHLVNKTDGNIIDRLVRIFESKGLEVKNLAAGAVGLDAWHQSPLGEYAIHFKGPDKDKIANPVLGMPSRYNLINNIIEKYQPTKVAEIGTWNGSRAVQMAEVAREAGIKNFHYEGFDLFEKMPQDKMAYEVDTKKPYSLDAVRRRLEVYAAYASTRGLNFTFNLNVGDTNETLKGRDLAAEGFQFVYLDGGHSEATVRNDWNASKDVPVVLFDDYVMGSDRTDCGVNVVFDGIEGRPKKVFACQDRMLGGGTTNYALTVKEPLELFNVAVPMIVKPMDSVEKEVIINAVKTNTPRIKRWIQPAARHDRVAVLVSAGPSLKERWALEDIERWKDEGATIFCVKHALPILLSYGIEPDFCTLLDPRPFDGTSTHGASRRELLKDIPKRTIFLVGSMSDTSVLTYLEEKNANVVGWHAFVQSLQNAELPELKGHMFVTGGTCSAWRQFSIAHMIGFRKFHLFGYDLYYNEGETEGVQQNLMKISIGKDGRSFTTTGELVAAAQDFEALAKVIREKDLEVIVHGDGIVATMAKDLLPLNDLISYSELKFSWETPVNE